MAEISLPTGEPSEGINTSPTIFRPCVLHTHYQHAANYVRIMVESKMSLPMGKDQLAPLIMEVLSLPSPYAILISLYNSYMLQYFTFGPPRYYHLFTLHCFCFCSGPAENQVGKPHLQFGRASSCWCNATAGVGSVGFSSGKIVGCASNGHSAPDSIFAFYFSAYLSMPSTPPSAPITGITDMEELVDAKASTSKISPPTTSADIEAASPKHCQVIPMPIPITTSRSSSSPSKLPVVVVPKLAVPVHALPEWINHPGGCKDYRCQLYAFQNTNTDCMLTHIQQHLEISIRYPMCSKGFQNTASLCKYGKKVHSIHIVEMENEWFHSLYWGVRFP